MTAKTNPLLDRVNKMPGEHHVLPSLGKFYNHGELSEDTVGGEILLFPMTMYDEILMKSPDMLYNGTAIEKVFQRCSPNIKKPLDLLTSDVDFILTHLRRISFGPHIEVPFTCSNTKCKHEQEVKVPLEYFTSEAKHIDVDHFDEKHTIISDTDKRTVRLKPITFREYLSLQQTNIETLADPEHLRNYVLESFVALIYSVDDIENDSPEHREFIKEWLDSIPREDANRIVDKLKGIEDWGPSFKYTVACSKCNHKNELTTELNPTAFFTQPSGRKTSKE